MDGYWIARYGFYRQKSYSPYEEVRNITSILIHPNFTNEEWETNDLALLRVDRPVVTSSHIKSPCLPNSNTEPPRIGAYCTVIGWGHQSEDGGLDVVDELQEVELEVMSNDECNRTAQYDGNEASSLFHKKWVIN